MDRPEDAPGLSELIVGSQSMAVLLTPSVFVEWLTLSGNGLDSWLAAWMMQG